MVGVRYLVYFWPLGWESLGPRRSTNRERRDSSHLLASMPVQVQAWYCCCTPVRGLSRSCLHSSNSLFVATKLQQWWFHLCAGAIPRRNHSIHVGPRDSALTRYCAVYCAVPHCNGTSTVVCFGCGPSRTPQYPCTVHPRGTPLHPCTECSAAPHCKSLYSAVRYRTVKGHRL